jgi:hypothetical protein
MVLGLLLAAAVGGCNDFLAVNTNPNAPENASLPIRLPAVIGGFAHSVYYGETALWGAEWTQQFSYNRATRSYAEVHRYELQDTDGTSAWNWFYAGPLNDANNLMKEATAENDIVYRGLGKFLYAWMFAHITDMWGPVPFTQTFDPTIREPKYDEQKVVYEAVHKLLDEAIAEMSSPTGRRPTTNDLLFNGDMTRWVKLARHVQARHHLRLAYAPGEDKVARAQKALTSIAAAFTSNADDAEFQYPGGANARNPLYTFQELQGQLVASEKMVELLRSRNDPRMPFYFRPAAYDSVRGTARYPAAPNTYRGHRNGAGAENDSTLSWVGTFFSNENASVSVASYADQKFTEAEARLIVSGAAAADAPYRDGIRASLQKYGISSASINAYLAARPALGTVTNALEEIITEKYVANYLKVESWNDWRRTGFPRLTIVEGALLPGIPQRVRTPGSELTNNINSVRATGIPTGLEGMMTKVWWASQGPR